MVPILRSGLHAFRHYAGTRIYMETGRLEDAAGHLGHASIETTRAYAKWADDGLGKVIEGW